MSNIIATCDIINCKSQQEWDNSDIEYKECPEQWGALILSDSSGELQTHYVCPQHIHLIWELLNDKHKTYEIIENKSPHTLNYHQCEECDFDKCGCVRCIQLKKDKNTQIETEQDTSPIFTTPQRKCGKCGHTQKNHKLTANDNMPCNVAHCACSNFAV